MMIIFPKILSFERSDGIFPMSGDRPPVGKQGHENVECSVTRVRNNDKLRKIILTYSTHLYIYRFLLTASHSYLIFNKYHK